MSIITDFKILTESEQFFADYWVNVHAAIRRMKHAANEAVEMIDKMKDHKDKNSKNDYADIVDAEQDGKLTDIRAYASAFTIDPYLTDKTKTPKDKSHG